MYVGIEKKGIWKEDDTSTWKTNKTQSTFDYSHSIFILIHFQQQREKESEQKKHITAVQLLLFHPSIFIHSFYSTATNASHHKFSSRMCCSHLSLYGVDTLNGRYLIHYYICCSTPTTKPYFFSFFLLSHTSLDSTYKTRLIPQHTFCEKASQDGGKNCWWWYERSNKATQRNDDEDEKKKKKLSTTNSFRIFSWLFKHKSLSLALT